MPVGANWRGIFPIVKATAVENAESVVESAKKELATADEERASASSSKKTAVAMEKKKAAAAKIEECEGALREIVEAEADPEAGAVKEDQEEKEEEVTLENPSFDEEATSENLLVSEKADSGPQEMVVLPVPVDFIVGDHIVCLDSWEEGRPKTVGSRAFGAVTGFTDKMVAKCVFTTSDETFEIDPRHLELEVAHADVSSQVA